MDLIDTLQHAARDRGSRGFHFVRGGTRVVDSLSFAELEEQAQEMGARLQGLDLSPGARVLLSLGPGLSFIRAFWSCLYAGLVPVPVPASRPRTQAVQKDCESSLKLDEEKWQGLLSQPPGRWKEPSRHPHRLAMLQYTSGSTRRPRGVKVTHHNLLTNLKALRRFHQRAPETVMAHWLPLHHDMGLIRGMLSPVEMGADAYLMDPMEFIQRPRRWLEMCTAFRATVTGAPNFGYERVNQKVSHTDGLDLSTLRVVFCTAEPIQPLTVERFLTRLARAGLRAEAFKPSYGLAEAAVMVAGADRPLYQLETDAGGEARVCCGRPVEGLEVVIVDGQGVPVGPGSEGEIWLRGPDLPDGYWNEPEATEVTFRAHTKEGSGPFLRTGDLGWLDDQGRLTVSGRLKDLLILRGRKLHPQDLEQAVQERVTEVRPGRIVAFPTEDGHLALSCELKDSSAEVFDTLWDEVRAALGEECGVALHELFVLETGATPKTSSGKLQRTRIRDLLRRGELAPRRRWRRPGQGDSG